jgi:hypothetical protein
MTCEAARREGRCARVGRLDGSAEGVSGSSSREEGTGRERAVEE